MTTAGAPGDDRPGTDAPAPRVERMVARFEAEATAEPRDADDGSGAVDYALRITHVREVVPLVARDSHAPDAGLTVADADARFVTATGEEPVALRRVEILQGFEFDVASGRVTGTLLFDRVIPVHVSPRREADVAPPIATVADLPSIMPVQEGRVSVLAGTGVNQHYEATLSWSTAAIDLDAHGFHFTRDGLASHVWHGHRPLGPVFWHHGPSTPEALDERLVITSATVDGLILCAIHSPVTVTQSPVRVIAGSGARVVLQLPNVRQSMHFEAPSRDGNLWIPFAILDGRLITTDVVATVSALPDEAQFRTLLGDLFAGLPARVTSPEPVPTPSDPPLDDWRQWQRPAIGLGSLAIALTLLVWMLRGAGRGAIMAIVGLLVLYLVVQARTRRR